MLLSFQPDRTKSKELLFKNQPSFRLVVAIASSDCKRQKCVLQSGTGALVKDVCRSQAVDEGLFKYYIIIFQQVPGSALFSTCSAFIFLSLNVFQTMTRRDQYPLYNPRKCCYLSELKVHADVFISVIHCLVLFSAVADVTRVK